VLLPLGKTYHRLDERYFAAHSDLDPAQIARLLGGTVVWHQERGGQWAAVVHIDRPQLAFGAAGSGR
jgi:hypothetical protein